MSDRPVLLLEIGCEEIPARMIPRAAEDLREIVVQILDEASLAHGEARSWGGSRRLTVFVDAVEGRQPDRDEQVLGPPARVAFDEAGEPTRAAAGFAKKQGIDPSELDTIETAKGPYAGFRRSVRGRSVGELLGRDLPAAVAAMSFPKMMRWADGRPRWVRPVHWILALHGREPVDLELFGIRSGRTSAGHRFLAEGPVEVAEPGAYESALAAGSVVADPVRRREKIAALLEAGARELGGSLVEDEGLLREVADLVELPGVVRGSFAPDFLSLPRELLVTTLRHHQKCFSVQDEKGDLLPGFLAVANTDRDPSGHIRRGNEWVVGGRLDDARFFWNEDRKQGLAERFPALENVVFHAALGSYADKARRMEALAARLAERLGMPAPRVEQCAEAARVAKIDLVTGTVGEFPELQGRVGGLMLRAEGRDPDVAGAVYAHYQPQGPEDELPPGDSGCVVSVADKLDSVACLLAAGEVPTGSRDPFGLRRATSGIFRIVFEREWPVSLADLLDLAGERETGAGFLGDRLRHFLRERGATVSEILAVLRPEVDAAGFLEWQLPDVAARLAAIGTVRRRPDFAHLADLTKRVDNILTKGREILRDAKGGEDEAAAWVEDREAALALAELVRSQSARIDDLAAARDYRAVVDALAGFVDPVERFFTDVLVLDPEHPVATLRRGELLAQLKDVLTRCFDIRELAGEADRRQHSG